MAILAGGFGKAHWDAGCGVNLVEITYSGVELGNKWTLSGYARKLQFPMRMA